MSDHDDKMKDPNYRRIWESLEYRDPEEMGRPSDGPPFNRSCFIWVMLYGIVMLMLGIAAIWAMS